MNIQTQLMLFSQMLFIDKVFIPSLSAHKFIRIWLFAFTYLFLSGMFTSVHQLSAYSNRIPYDLGRLCHRRTYPTDDTTPTFLPRN